MAYSVIWKKPLTMWITHYYYWFYGITAKANVLIKYYLNDRYQRVLIDKYSNTAFSGWGLVKQGVPQGSVLGPLFFLLYINYHPKTVSNLSKQVLFADGTSIIVTNHGPTTLIKYLEILMTGLELIYYH